MKSFRVGVDSYSLKPLGLSPFEVLDWVKKNGGDGVQFSEVNLRPDEINDKKFLKDLSLYASEKGLYLEWGGMEHIPFNLETGKEKVISIINRRAAEQAKEMEVRVVRSCSAGLMRWKEDSLATEILLKEMARSLKAQRQMLLDLDIIMAIETHFEFTTFELLRLFEMCGAQPGEYLGICLDTMNLLTMLEDPVKATRRICPWIVSTHIKDGTIILTERGLISFPVEGGKGVIDFEEILEILSSSETNINLSIEDHGGEFLIPIFDPLFLSRFPDLEDSEFSSLLTLAAKSQKLMDEGKISILERERWPEHCQERVKKGIENIKRIVKKKANR